MAVRQKVLRFLFVSVLFAVFLERQIKRYMPFLKAPFRANGLCMNTSVVGRRARPCGPELGGGTSTCIHIRRDSFAAEGYYDCWAGDMF